MKSAVRVLGLSWDSETPTLVLGPASGSDAPVALSLGAGQRLALRVIGPRRCVGRGGACPRGWRLPARGAGLCGFCRASTRALLSLGRTDAFAVAAYGGLRTVAHTVYLALFGHDHVKVGVTARQPPTRRLLEQGAMAALLFADADGIRAREVEHLAAARGIATVVRTTRKVRLLSEVPTPADAANTLGDVFGRLREAVPDGALRAVPELLYLVPHYVGQLPIAPEPVRLLAAFWPGDQLVGRIRAVVGQLVVIADAVAGLVAVDATRLQGYLVHTDVGGEQPSTLRALSGGGHQPRRPLPHPRREPPSGWTLPMSL